jgi:hypothetical protein
VLVIALPLGCSGVAATQPPPHVFPGGYERLSDAGLFADHETGTVAAGMVSFTPNFVLWSDGAEKRRWVSLPPGAKIDTSDPDRWQFPVGTRFFKEFASKDGTLLETRIVERIAATGDPERDYWMGAFAWRDDGTDADFVPEGLPDVRGTRHDVPSADACHTCHNGETGRILGFSEVQLAGEGEGIRLGNLVAAGRLSAEPAGWSAAADGPVTDGLGYLHANCGHCHNPQGSARPDSDLDLRWRATDRDPTIAGAYRTAVGHPLFRFAADTVTGRAVPGDPDASGLVYRMSRRESRVSMPPIASEVVDPRGVELVRSWIESLR